MPPIERVSWEEFGDRFDWRQGEHVSLVGPTGSGKSTLATEILPRRDFAVALASKPRDETLDRLARSGYKTVKEWPPPGPPELCPRVLLWPTWRTPADTLKQRHVFAEAIDGIFSAGSWCLYIDELAYAAKDLALAAELRLLWQQGRSLRISVVGATQRPAWVPLEMYSQATHLFFWRQADERDRKRISGIGQADPATIRHQIAELGKHEVLYVNAATADQLITQVEV